MSRATKRKHVVKEVEDFSTPLKTQSIVRILESRGNNLHEVEDSTGNQYLVSMPTKFRKNIWVKRGDFLLVEPILEGDKVKAEIVKILTREHQKWYRAEGYWPKEFDESSKSYQQTVTKDDRSESEDDLFVNTNRWQYNSNEIDNDDSSTDESEFS